MRAAEEPDETLVPLARAGDEAAFARLVDRHRQRVYQLCLRLVGGRADAEDVLQETFVQVFRKLGSFRGQSRFSTWLYRIATNTALMHRRSSSHRRVESLEAYLPRFRSDGRHREIDVDYSAAARVESSVEREELGRLLLEALGRLPERYRAAVVLYDLEELPATEAAAVLGIEPATLRQRVHRGRLMLRGYLDALARGERR